MVKIIEKNGGKVTDQHECFTYQLKLDKVKTNFQEYYKGAIYSTKWIIESIKEGKLLKKEDYFMCINVHEKSRRLNIGKKKKYTIIEGIKMFETVGGHKSEQVNTPAFWTKVVNQSIFPERTADSLKNFWKKIEYKQLEQYLIDCVHEKTDFCLSFKRIPNDDFIQRFRQKFASDFIKLEALKDIDSDMNGTINEQEQELERKIMMSGNFGRQQVFAPL